MFRCLFLDLDDTIFPSNIPFEAFGELFSVFDDSRLYEGPHDLSQIKGALYQKTLAEVVQEFNLSQSMIQAYLEKMENVSFNFEIEVYPDYRFLKGLSCDKYLITSGSQPIQEAKINALGIEKDFIEIYYDDRLRGSHGKKSIFQGLMQTKNLNPDHVLVIGDNPGSEIKAARELGILGLLIDREGKYDDLNLNIIYSFEELRHFL